MAYGSGSALNQLVGLLSRIPRNGALLELGAQDINANVPQEAIVSTLHAIHGEQIPASTIARFDAPGPWRTGELFRGSSYRYQCIDLFPGDFTIVGDLNTLQVADADRASFNLIVNQGTSEHVADQINCFRVVHDYAAVGTIMLHAVPFAGYFNHGLYNYHPLFFVFMAHANEYAIEGLALSDTHFPHTIPETSFPGAKAWSATVMQSGIVTALLRKVNDAPFRLFTDYDQAQMGRMAISEPWASVIRDRYDLRVRTMPG
jgi:hypothetical protein